MNENMEGVGCREEGFSRSKGAEGEVIWTISGGRGFGGDPTFRRLIVGGCCDGRGAGGASSLSGGLDSCGLEPVDSDEWVLLCGGLDLESEAFRPVGEPVEVVFVVRDASEAPLVERTHPARMAVELLPFTLGTAEWLWTLLCFAPWFALALSLFSLCCRFLPRSLPCVNASGALIEVVDTLSLRCS